MYSVYKIQVKKNEYLDKVTILSNNLYNFALYNVRQFFFENGEYLNYYGNYPLCKNNENYKQLYSQTAQQVLQQVDNSFKSFFKANKAYKKYPEKFLGKPKIPKYKEKGSKSIVTLPGQHLKIKNNYLIFPKSNYKLFLGELKFDKIVEVKIKPYKTYYEILITYENNLQYKKLETNENYISIDLGIDNFVTIANNTGKKPILVKGKRIKSINQFYNKKKTKLMSNIKNKGNSNKLDQLTKNRNNKIENYIHDVSSFIVKYCLENNISNIVIGKNKNWKQEVNIGKQNNQNFISIPHSSFIFKLQYKAQRHNINVILNEESYTSKCDALAIEDIKKKDEYFGKRIKRGLFKSRYGLINADVNGSLNILRKVIGNDFISLLNRGLVMNPEVIVI